MKDVFLACTLLFYILSTLFTIFYSILAMPVLLLVPVSLRICISAIGTRVLLYLCKISDGITYEVVGKENLPQCPFIIASEHQSPLETMALFVELKDVVFIMKRELKLLPIIGMYFVAIGMIFIDRSKGVSALRKMVRECGIRVKEGRTIVIFPEGTRVSDDDRSNREYHGGVAMVYQQLKIPVVPVVLNTGKFWPSGIVSLSKKRGKATLKILPLIEPGLGREEFMDMLKKRIYDGSRHLDYQ